MQKEVYEFISEKTGDPIIERCTCRVSGEEFAIFQSDKDFLEKVSPSYGEVKYLIPFPTLCPEERLKRRLMFKNERKLFRTTCGLTGKPIISTHAPDSGFQVYSVAARWSDDWDPMRYGQVRDPTHNFFDQYKKLYRNVPQIAMMNDNGLYSENIEYCQNVAYSKNCYLTTVAWKLEHAYYSSNMAGGSRLLDCFFTMSSEQCYECCDSNTLYGCGWLQYAYNCQDCWFGYDLTGCKDCLACVNLRDSQYCIFNTQYSKEEYELKKQNFFAQLHKNFDILWQQFVHFVEQYPHRATYTTHASDTYSSNLYNAEKAIFCYNIQNAKHTKYCIFGDTMEDAMDLTVGGELQLCYEGNVPDHSYRACFSVFCRSCTNIFYSDMCHGCKDCFGCVGLRNKQYCIFNKQYTKQEYEHIVPQIITHMQACGERGEFFPKEMAPYHYNISTVMDYFPVDAKEAIQQGYRWRDNIEEINVPPSIKVVTARELTTLSDEEIPHVAVTCIVSGRPFRILAPELSFYRKRNLPLPVKHFDVRFEERLQRMPKKNMHLRICDKTGKQVLSVYPEGVPFKVYSEEAYKQEVYG